jgi:hypothetical protein
MRLRRVCTIALLRPFVITTDFPERAVWLEPRH